MMHYFSRPAIVGALACCLAATFIAGCGSSTATATTTNTGTAATATAKSCATTRSNAAGRTTTGVIQSVTGSTLMITKADGSSVKATYSDKTRFAIQDLVEPSVLQSGGFVQVSVTQNADSTYTATRISVVDRQNGNGNQGQKPQQNSPCAKFRPGQASGAGANGAAGGNTKADRRTLTGTIGQVNGSSLTISDTRGDDYTVTLTKDTQITHTSVATASALQTGQHVLVTGKPDSSGVIAIQSITVILAGNTGSANK